jgi:hypothetical protein
MKDRTKYILIGIVIGIIIGMAMFYLLINFRIIRPFGFGDIRGFPRNNTFSNFTRPPIGA